MSARLRLPSHVPVFAAGGVLVLAFLTLALLYPLASLYSQVIPNAIETKPAWSLIERGIIVLDKPLYVGAIVALHLVYFGALIFAIRRARREESDARSEKRQALIVWVAGGVCALILLWSYPLFSQDVFDYLFHTHEWVAYGASPFTHVPAQFSFDPLYPYVSWTQAPSPYGPVWIYLTAALSWLAGENLFANLVLFKLLSVASYLGSTLLLFLILDRFMPRYRLAGTFLFALNPLVLMEFGGSGHNDIVMLFFAMLAAWLVVNRRFGLGLASLTASALVKIVTIFLFPIFLAFVWRRLVERKGNGITHDARNGGRSFVSTIQNSPLLALALYLLLSVALAGCLYLPIWEGLDSMAFLRRGDIVGGAPVGNVVTDLMALFASRDLAANLWKVIAWGTFGVLILRQTWSVLRGTTHSVADLPLLGWLNDLVARVTLGGSSRASTPDQTSEGRATSELTRQESEPERLFRANLSVMFYYAVVVSQYYQPWYLSWALIWAGVLLSRRYALTVWTLLIFSAVAVAGYVYL